MKPMTMAWSVLRAMTQPGSRRPRIVMTLLCRDEEDIVGYNIAFHLAQGVDFVIATDNASRDRTPQVLQRFERLGKLKLLREPSLTHDQGVWVTRMARMAASRYGADWVINNDADEFWYARQGSLRSALAALPREVDCLEVPRFDMLPPARAEGKFYETMLLYAVDGRFARPGQHIPKACHRGYDDVRIADGNHRVKHRGAWLTGDTAHPLQILHFPVRSLSQLERKIRQGAEALHANPRLNPAVGDHWRRLYREHLLTGRLQDHYAVRVPAHDQIQAGLASGELVQETRIRDVLRQLDPKLVDADGR